MNRNKISDFNDLIHILSKETDIDNIKNFITELFTESELETISKRWQIIKMLNDGETQRNISKKLGVSLCKVTRGSQILKNKKSTVSKYLKGEKIYE